MTWAVTPWIGLYRPVSELLCSSAMRQPAVVIFVGRRIELNRTVVIFVGRRVEPIEPHRAKA